MSLHPVLLEKLNAALAPAPKNWCKSAPIPRPVTMDRELTQAARADPRATRRLLELSRDPVIPGEETGVSVQPAYELLLAEPD